MPGRMGSVMARDAQRRASHASSNRSRYVGAVGLEPVARPPRPAELGMADLRPCARTARCRRASRGSSRPRHAAAPRDNGRPARSYALAHAAASSGTGADLLASPRRTPTTSRPRCPPRCSRGRARGCRRRRSPGCRRATPARCAPTSRCAPRRASDVSPSRATSATPRQVVDPLRASPRSPRSRTAGCAARDRARPRASRIGCRRQRARPQSGASSVGDGHEPGRARSPTPRARAHRAGGAATRVVEVASSAHTITPAGDRGELVPREAPDTASPAFARCRCTVTTRGQEVGRPPRRERLQRDPPAVVTTRRSRPHPPTNATARRRRSAAPRRIARPRREHRRHVRRARSVPKIRRATSTSARGLLPEADDARLARRREQRAVLRPQVHEAVTEAVVDGVHSDVEHAPSRSARVAPPAACCRGCCRRPCSPSAWPTPIGT